MQVEAAMKTGCRAFLVPWLLWLGLSGCGGKSSAPNPPVSNACTGVTITGRLKDSLTNQPVAQGVAVLESGTKSSIVSIYNFYPKQQAAADVHGAFSVCAPSVASPSALVIEAMDSAGNAYPPFVAPVSGATELGNIPMGGCTGLCGLAGEQQTSAPATITGVVTSTPIALAGTVVPQYVVQALDRSKGANGATNLWALAMPAYNTEQTFTFNTTAGSCAGGAPFCASYTFKLPSQSPVWRVSGGTVQAAVAPGYLIYAAAGDAVTCILPYALTVFQQDGASMLAGKPGAQLYAADLNFAGCR